MTIGIAERLTEQFQALCAELPSHLDNCRENGRLFALNAAKKAVRQLQTPAEFAEGQLWAPIDLAGAAVACDLGIPEILSEGKSPMTLDEIVSRAKGDNVLAYRVLRFLVAQGMVDQIAEDSYAANRITRDYTTEIRKASVFKQLFCMPSYAAMPWFLRETNFQNCTDPGNCAWQPGLNTDQTFWQWIESRPEMSAYFNIMMRMSRGRFGDDLARQYPFEKIFNESSCLNEVAFVDVGGGIGQQCTNLRMTFPRQYGRFILQDLPYVVEGKEIEDVEVMAIDMMKEQPIKGAKVYYLRGVCHDHSDEVCRKFLTHVKEAMNEHSRLLIHEKLVADMNPTLIATRFDFMMMAQFASMERSASQFRDLLESLGFKVVGNHGSESSEWKIVEAMVA